jgi:hypothetical protein
VEYSFDYQPSEEPFQEALGQNDVVWIPLYLGTINDPAVRKDEKRQENAANWKAISAIAPKVRAVLVGNANAEIHYELEPKEEFERCLTFVEQHGDRIRPFGRPAFAPIMENLVYDAFHGGGKLRELLLSMDALVLSYAGSEWFFEKERPRIPEPRPFPTMRAYLSELEAWTGVGLQRGLDNGSGRVLKDAGYSAGFMGYF